MADTIPTVRRTIAGAMDETCTRLDACPPIPVDAQVKTLSSGSIADKWTDGVLERWRMDNEGNVKEYYHFKPRAPLCPWDAVWWRD